MDAPRHLLLARDPVAAWRDHAASPAWRAVAAEARVFVSSDRGADAFGWRGPRTTLERWARTPPVVVADPLVRRRALVAAIVAESPMGPAADPLRIAEDAAGYAGVAGPAVRELLRVADLDAPPAGLAPSLARWWRVARRYRDALAADGLADPAEVLRLASRRVRRGEVGPRPIAVLGHLDLQPDEVDLIDALAAPGSVVVLPHDPPWTDANEPARAGLRARGWSETIADGAGAAGPSARVVARAPATREAEARWAVAEAKRLLLAGVPPDDVTIASRDLAAYAGAVRTAARAAGLPLRVERWVPLASTVLAAPVMAWLEAVAQRGAFEPTLAWLAHPRVAQLTADEIDLVRRWRPDDVRAWRRVGATVADALAWPERAFPRAWAERLASGWGGFGARAAGGPGHDGRVCPSATPRRRSATPAVTPSPIRCSGPCGATPWPRWRTSPTRTAACAARPCSPPCATRCGPRRPATATRPRPRSPTEGRRHRRPTTRPR